jgi:hypothetical protein
MLNRTQRNTSKKENGQRFFFTVEKDKLSEIKKINETARFYSFTPEPPHAACCFPFLV